MTLKDEAIVCLVRAVNALLAAEGRHYRVTSDDIVTAQRDGRMLIALTTTRDAPDWRNTRAYSTMGGKP